MIIKIDFSSSILFFHKGETDFSQTNNFGNFPIDIALVELNYQESKCVTHQIFDRLRRLHLNMAFEHQ